MRGASQRACQLVPNMKQRDRDLGSLARLLKLLRLLSCVAQTRMVLAKLCSQLSSLKRCADVLLGFILVRPVVATVATAVATIGRCVATVATADSDIQREA